MHKLGVRPEMTIIKTAARVGPDMPLLAPPLTNFNAPWHNPPQDYGWLFSPHLPRDLRSDQLSNSRFTSIHPGPS